MKQIINSLDNKKIKEIRKLKQKKYRNKEKKYIIESKKMVTEAISLGARIDMIILEESLDEKVFDNTSYVSKEVFKSLSSLESPDGYMAIVNKIPELDLQNIGDKSLILDRIQDPGNLGTLIRSAEAFGFNHIVLINCVDLYNDKTLRSTMGSIYRVNLYEVSEDEFIKNFSDRHLYFADMDGQDYKKIKFEKPLGLIIGNEANGISDKIINMKGKIISIPMQGKIESLNAAVSGSILMSNIN